MTARLPYAEDVPYWKTSRSSADAWIEKAVSEIESAGGRVLQEARGKQNGKSAFLLVFEILGDVFKIHWPVLDSRCDGNPDESSRRRQAATFIYHDVKARCCAAKILGARRAFFSYLLLKDGRTAADVGEPQALSELLPLNLPAPK